MKIFVLQTCDTDYVENLTVNTENYTVEWKSKVIIWTTIMRITQVY